MSPRWNESIKDFVFEHGSYKLVALAIALILWGTLLSRKEVVYLKYVDLVFEPGEHRVVANDVATQVEFRISGARIPLKRFANRSVEPIHVDLSGVEIGRRLVAIPEDALKLPGGVRVLSVNPPSVNVELSEAQSKMVSVRAVVDEGSKSLEGLSILSIEPSKIAIEGTAEVLARINEVPTERIRLDQLSRFNGAEVVDVNVPLQLTRNPGLRPLGVKRVVVKFSRKK